MSTVDADKKQHWPRWRRWPLTRQITILFTLLMIGNAVLITTALDFWADYRLKEAVASLSPKAQRTYAQWTAGKTLPNAADVKELEKEFKPTNDTLDTEFDLALYIMVALSACVTVATGYVLLGRLGRGLNSLALAARQISAGDLSARAEPVGFASLEEAQLIGDFNSMAAELQRAERELAESTASIAHELRTPLTILRGRLHGIADGVFALQPCEVDGLLYQVEGLGRLVDDLQTLSLANSQRLILALEKTDMAQEVQRVLATMEPDLKAAGLEIALALTETSLIADGARIRQVISAVLANACRYAPNSGILRISAFREPHNSVLEIVDHGPGLPDGADNRVFDRFWRGEESRSRNTGGSGLGLSVVRAIVEAHKGSATLKNDVGGGAIFQMRLPVDGKLQP